MQVYCQYSGLQMAVIDDGLPNTILSHHPIFDLDLPAIYKLVQTTQPALPKVRMMQQRLFFLALLKATTLVDWQAPYYPSDEGVANAYPILLGVLSILPNKIPSHWTLPKLRISPENNKEIDIKQVLLVWKQQLGDYHKLDAQASRPVSSTYCVSTALALTDRWRKRVTESGLKPEMIDWAIDLAMEAYGSTQSESRYAQWRQLLATAPAKLKVFQTRAVAELQLHLMDILPASDDVREYTYMVLKHVQLQLDHLVELEAKVMDVKTTRVRTLIADVTEYKVVAVDEQSGKDLADKTAILSGPDKAAYNTSGDYMDSLVEHNKSYYANWLKK